VEQFSSINVLGWAIKDAAITIEGVNFTMIRGAEKIHVQSELLGRHQIAPLAVVAAMAEKLGMIVQDIEKGAAMTKPFDHRMQPRLMSGAWLIDDTYNGNLEGMQAGLALLKELKATRKWYVTPGLVDQGAETERVHQELGKTIADANPNIVVLMENSVRPIIEQAMKNNGFSGELRIEPDPLGFYTSLEHTVANGDIILMQNDWTDNYI
jgi:UDP-N-acetylmuramoyl-tripeptide--D-alanyl-D-alanine ligase